MNIKEIEYKQFGKCIKVDNGVLELIIPLEFGIRILKIGWVNGSNLFAELPDAQFDIGGKVWHFYGGHRLWVSPETKQTYFPDSQPISYSIRGELLKLAQPLDTYSNVVKEMDITLSESNVKVVHRLINRKNEPQKLSLWAITVMAPGGIEVIPFTGKATGWLHNRQISLWPYSKMNDPRLNWFGNFVTLTQDSKIKEPVKIGISNHEGWGLYVNQGTGFIKKFKPVGGGIYPDNNVWYETYTNDAMLELETLSPFAMVNPGESVEHLEEWSIFEAKPLLIKDENSISKYVDAIKEKLV